MIEEQKPNDPKTVNVYYSYVVYQYSLFIFSLTAIGQLNFCLSVQYEVLWTLGSHHVVLHSVFAEFRIDHRLIFRILQVGIDVPWHVRAELAAERCR